MMMINQYYIFEIDCCRLIGQINLMIEGQVPDRESFKFCIACFYSSFVFMIKIAQAGCKLPAAWPGARDNHNGIGSFDIFICTVSIITDNKINIGGITFCRFMGIDLNAVPFKLVFE